MSPVRVGEERRVWMGERTGERGTVVVLRPGPRLTTVVIRFPAEEAELPAAYTEAWMGE